MAGPKLIAILSDDWELRGNGQGTVQEHQATPARRLMDLYEELDVPCTFNIEVMQQLAFLEVAKKYDSVEQEALLWQDTVTEMVRRGADTQLHIHPQWAEARYSGTDWSLGRTWDITRLAPKQQAKMVRDGASAFRRFTGRAPVAFRAGSWAAGPPSEHLFKALIAEGIQLDCSVVHGTRYRGDAVNLDYRRLECPHLPYKPDLHDLRRVGPASGPIVEVPTQSIRFLPVRQELALRLWRIKERLKATRTPAVPSFDPFGLNHNRSVEPIILDFSSKREQSLMLWALRRVVERARKSSMEGPIPLVFENHSKDLRSNDAFDRVKSYVEYLQEQPDVEFDTMGGLAGRLDELTVRTSDA